MERPMQILLALAEQADEGMRLTDLSVKTGLGKSTVFRVLSKLQAVRLVERDRNTRRFFLGMAVFILGQAAAGRFGIVELARPTVLRLSESTADTVYLTILDGLEAVCLIRQEGSFPIKVLTMRVGERRPLGVGTGGMAMLSALPHEEARHIVAACTARYGDYPHFDGASIEQQIADTRQNGYSFSDDLIVPGMRAIGVAILNPSGRPVAALTVGAITERMQPDRLALLAGDINAEVAVIEKRISELSNIPGPTDGWRRSAGLSAEET
jgi:DNA-binding IclR family transcriptional regulator